MKLIESIKYEKGEFVNLELHSERMNNARTKLFACTTKFDLESALYKIKKPQSSENTVYKCRIIYNQEIEKIELIPYSIPKIKSLKIVYDNKIDYSFKFADRSRLNNLFAKRQNADDILIVKDQLITDTYFCNVLFYNGNKWLSPEKPLLKGIQRQYLLDNEIVETADIRLSDLHNFEKARLINAMISFGDNLEIPIKSIC